MPKPRPRGFEAEQDDRDEPLGKDFGWWVCWFLLIVFGMGSLGWVTASYISNEYHFFEMQKICRSMLAQQNGRTVCYIEKNR